MANMSYCRFENTVRDMFDCVDAFEEVIEEGGSMDDFLSNLSSDHERASVYRLLSLAHKFIELYDQTEG